MTTDKSRADALTTTKLPDGSGFAVASLPLPQDHWLYASRCAEWDSERDTSADTPHPILTHAQRDAVVAAVRYAIRSATMCGQDMDFDPDALVLNAVYALCGPFSPLAEDSAASPVEQPAAAQAESDNLQVDWIECEEALEELLRDEGIDSQLVGEIDKRSIIELILEKAAPSPIDTPTDREFALSAAICVHPKGVYGDEGGSMCCPITHTRDASFAPSPADERLLMARVNDCTKPIDAADRNGILKLIDRLAASQSSQPAAAPIDVGVDCLEKLRALMVRLGVATNESLEGFGASLEDNLYRTIRAVNAVMDAAMAPTAPAPAPADERAPLTMALNPNAPPLTMTLGPAQAAEPVAQWQARLKDRSSPVVDHWVNISPDGAKTLMEKYANVYEVRALYAAPQPSAQADAREGLTDEQRSTLESLARTSTPYEQEVLRSILATHPGQSEPRRSENPTGIGYDTPPEELERILAQGETRAEVTVDQPSLANPLTPYGMLVRALRIVAQTSLHDMGQALLLSPSKLSAMEFGREPVTPEIVREIGTYFESLGIHNMRPALQFAIDAATTGDQS